MRIIATALIIMAFAAPSIAVAESNQNSAYYCVGEVAAGLKYDETQKQWKGTAFTPDQKFVLRLRLVRTFLKKKENQFDEDETIRVYNVILTNRGSLFGDLCCRLCSSRRPAWRKSQRDAFYRGGVCTKIE